MKPNSGVLILLMKHAAAYVSFNRLSIWSVYTLTLPFHYHHNQDYITTLARVGQVCDLFSTL